MYQKPKVGHEVYFFISIPVGGSETMFFLTFPIFSLLCFLFLYLQEADEDGGGGLDIDEFRQAMRKIMGEGMVSYH